MGSFFSSLFSSSAPPSTAPLHPSLKQLFTNKTHLRIFTHLSSTRTLQRVDFEHLVPVDGFNGGLYRIMLKHDIPASGEVVCVFPNHPNTAKQVIQMSQYYRLSSFNRDLNERFRASLDWTDGIGTTKLCVVYGNHAFVCQGITGTAYIVWARHISHTNHSNVASLVNSNVPLIINMDGRMVIKRIFILKPVVQDVQGELMCIPITQQSPELFFPLQQEIFVSEVDPLRERRRKIQTLSYRDALYQVVSRSKSAHMEISQEENPYSLDVEDNDSDMGWTTSFNYGQGPDAGTPRTAVFCAEIPTDIRRLQHTPPVLMTSDDDEEIPDPFAQGRKAPQKEKENIV